MEIYLIIQFFYGNTWSVGVKLIKNNLTKQKGKKMNDIKNCIYQNVTDVNGNPTGGTFKGIGIDISWQNGPLGRDDERKEPNGAFVETVISAAKQRIEFYQMANNGKFSCRHNAFAITKLEEALHWLDARTKEREERQVEGTHKV